MHRIFKFIAPAVAALVVLLAAANVQAAGRRRACQDRPCRPAAQPRYVTPRYIVPAASVGQAPAFPPPPAEPPYYPAVEPTAYASPSCPPSGCRGVTYTVR